MHRVVRPDLLLRCIVRDYDPPKAGRGVGAHTLPLRQFQFRPPAASRSYCGASRWFGSERVATARAALASRPALVKTVDMLAVDLDECLFLVGFLFAASRASGGLWSLRHLLDDQLIVVELDQNRPDWRGLTTTAGS